MAIYDNGTASLAANGQVTGIGTQWTMPLTLIRVGATLVFKTEPVQIYTISEITSDTSISVYNPNGETVPAGTGYAILAHDGITVQGLAQDVAETLRYYQSRETEVADAVDAFNNFDAADFDSKVSQVNTQHSDVVSIGTQVASDAIQVASDKDAAAASALSASNDRVSAELSAREAAESAASVNAEYLLKSYNNLSDVEDKFKARVNLGVTSVDYRMFGAALDGVTDDTDAVIACHNYANLMKLKVKQGPGYAMVRPDSDGKQIVINTDCEYFGGFEFITDSVNGRGFVVRSPNDEINLSQSDVNPSEFIESRMKIPSLADYANHSCFIVGLTNDYDLNRKRDNGPAYQLKRQPIIIGDNGTLDAPLWSTFSSGMSMIRLQSIFIPTITISGLTLRTFGSISKASPFGAQRNNVVIKNFHYIDGSTTQKIPIQSLISIEFCSNVTIDGVSSAGLSKGIIDYNYTINTWVSSNIRISNITSFDGWAQVDGNYCRNVMIENSTIDRVGSHYRGYDYTFKNLNSRRGRCIAVSGGGLLSVENIKIYIDSSVTADEQYTAVSLRGDYGAEWVGQISIKDVVMDFTNFYSSSAEIYASILSCFIDSTVGAHDFNRIVSMPSSIYVSDCSFIINNPSRFYGRAVGVGCTSAITSGVRYPSSISVSNVNTMSISNGRKYCTRGVDWNTQAKNETYRNDVSIMVSSVNNIDPGTYGETVTNTLPATNSFLNSNGGNTRINASIRSCNWQSIVANGSNISVNVEGGSVAYFNGNDGVNNRINFSSVQFNGTLFYGAIKATVIGCYFNNYVDYLSNSLPIGGLSNADANISFIISTATAFGASIKGTVITPANAKSGYAQSGRYQ